jgi:hypothetical protein
MVNITEVNVFNTYVKNQFEYVNKYVDEIAFSLCCGMDESALSYKYEAIQYNKKETVNNGNCSEETAAGF